MRKSKFEETFCLQCIFVLLILRNTTKCLNFYILQSQSDGQLYTFDAKAARLVTGLNVTIFINPSVATTEAADDATTSTDAPTDPTISTDAPIDPTTIDVTTETMTSNDTLNYTTQSAMTTDDPLDASAQQSVTIEIRIRACLATGIACVIISK